MASARAGKARLISLCVPLLCVTAPLGALPRGRLPGIAVTDVCTLSKGPADLNGKMVRVRAHMHVVVEGALLTDRTLKCNVGLAVPRAIGDDPDMKSALIPAMDASKDVSATVTGEFFVRRSRGRRGGIIDAIKITGLKVTPVKLVPRR